jgi:hypothetical protein
MFVSFSVYMVSEPSHATTYSNIEQFAHNIRHYFNNLFPLFEVLEGFLHVSLVGLITRILILCVSFSFPKLPQ